LGRVNLKAVNLAKTLPVATGFGGYAGTCIAVRPNARLIRADVLLISCGIPYWCSFKHGRASQGFKYSMRRARERARGKLIYVNAVACIAGKKRAGR
jgi:hypothetical protein